MGRRRPVPQVDGLQPPGLWWKTQIYAAYDGDTDGRITKDEFRGRRTRSWGGAAGAGCPQVLVRRLGGPVFPSVDNAGTLLMGSNVIAAGLFLDKLQP